MISLTPKDLLHVAERVRDGDVKVSDYGSLESALARPQTTAFSRDAYPALNEKAAALLHSLHRRPTRAARLRADRDRSAGALE